MKGLKEQSWEDLGEERTFVVLLSKPRSRDSSGPPGSTFWESG